MLPGLRPVWRYKVGGRITSISWSHDGSKIAVGSYFKNISLSVLSVFERRDEDDFRDLDAVSVGYDPINSISWSPDGERLALGLGRDNLGLLAVLDVPKGYGEPKIYSKQVLTGAVYTTYWTKDGKYIVFGGSKFLALGSVEPSTKIVWGINKPEIEQKLVKKCFDVKIYDVVHSRGKIYAFGLCYESEGRAIPFYLVAQIHSRGAPDVFVGIYGEGEVVDNDVYEDSLAVVTSIPHKLVVYKIVDTVFRKQDKLVAYNVASVVLRKRAETWTYGSPSNVVWIDSRYLAVVSSRKHESCVELFEFNGKDLVSRAIAVLGFEKPCHRFVVDVCRSCGLIAIGCEDEILIYRVEGIQQEVEEQIEESGVVPLESVEVPKIDSRNLVRENVMVQQSWISTLSIESVKTLEHAVIGSDIDISLSNVRGYGYVAIDLCKEDVCIPIGIDLLREGVDRLRIRVPSILTPGIYRLRLMSLEPMGIRELSSSYVKLVKSWSNTVLDVIGKPLDVCYRIGHFAPLPKVKKFGNYMVMGIVGEGSFSLTLLGYSSKHGFVVVKYPKTVAAMNMLYSDAVHEETVYVPETFRREIAIVEQLRDVDHPHILKILDVVRQPVPMIVMEFCACGSLADVLRSGVRLGVDKVLVLGIQISDALKTLYRLGIAAHHDIKPSNILIDARGVAKLGDLNTAKIMASLHRSPSIAGTYGYAPPEQMSGSVQPSEKSDVFSLAIVMLESILGYNPLLKLLSEGLGYSEAVEKLRRILETQQLGIELPKDVEVNLRKTLVSVIVVKPDDRISIDEFQQRLAEILAEYEASVNR